MIHNELYNKLINDVNVTTEEILTHPLFLEAQRVSETIERTADINTPERQKLRAEIEDELLGLGSTVINEYENIKFNGNIKIDKRADIIIGLPAAGKSSVLAEPISQKYGSRIIDSDMAKERLPEYLNGIGANAVHLESKGIIDKVFNRAIDKGENVVVPIVGDKTEKVLEFAERLKTKGYSIFLHLNEVTNEESIKRAAIRFFVTGRYIPVKVLQQYRDNPSKVYEEIKQKEVFNGYSKYDNNVRRGEKAICIENYDGTEVPTMENRRNSNRQNSDRIDIRTTGHRRNDIIGDSAIDLIPVEKMRVFKENASSVLVKMSSEKSQDFAYIWLPKAQIQLDKDKCVVAVNSAHIAQYGLKPINMQTIKLKK